MMKKKKKPSRSQSSSKKTSEPSPDSSPSPRLLSLFRSKLGSGKDLKHMLGMRSKTVPGLSSQSRIVRCPKCQKLLQEPIDATCYKCGGCDSILQAKRWELQRNDNTIPEALLSSENRSLSTGVESAEGGWKTPMRDTHRENNPWASHTHREYDSRAMPSVERGYHSETVYKHETSDIRREWMRRADEFSVAGDSDLYASARSSPYNSRSHASEWTQHGGRYQDPPRVPFYPASPSPSSAYEYGYSSPYHRSQASASEQSYNHQPNQFKQYGREGSFQESFVASPNRFPGEISDGKYYHCSSQSQLQDLQNHYLYESSSSATPHRSVYSERSYQPAAVPHRYTYSEHYMGISKSETSSERSSDRDKKQYVKERNPVVKRHVFPSAGGAPFATCTYCLELLELPQVALHGKHKRHQVKCGSCSGVLKLFTRDKVETVLDSPSFVDSGMDFGDETVTIPHDDQASASDGHEEIYADGTPMSCSDNDSGDAICKGTNDVMLSRSLEIYEDRQSISSEISDSKLEALQPQLKPLVNHRFREQQLASSETIKEASRLHLEQSQEAHSEKLTMDKKINERVGYELEESRYEKNEILKPREMVGDGSGESLEVTVYMNKKMSQSSEEAEIVAESPVFHSAKPRTKKEYDCETYVLSENTRETHEFDWKETQENEEYGGETSLKEIMGDKPGLHLEKSQYAGDSISDSSSSNGEEDTEHISNTFSDAKSYTSQPTLKSLVNENQEFITHPDHSGEVTVTISDKIHGEQTLDSKLELSQHTYESLSERQESDKIITDRVRYGLEETRYETLEPGKVGEDESGVSLEKASETFRTTKEGETGEERSVSHQVDHPKENVEISCETLEPIYLQGSGYAGESAWEETIGDRAGLHLEEYESNYENYNTPFEWTSERAPTFRMHEDELGEILEPEEGADGRSEPCSRGSFDDHESSEENEEFHESQDAKPEQSQDECENSSKRQELSSTDFDMVRSELQECTYKTNEMLEPGRMVGAGSVVSPEKISETIKGETGEDNLSSHQMEPENKNVEHSYGTVESVYLEGSGYASERAWAETTGNGAGLQLEEYQSNPYEWTSERAPTFRLHEYEPGTIPEPDEDTDGRSISSSRDSCNDHESLKGRAVSHEEPWLLDVNKTKALKVGVMVEDGPSVQLEKCEDESTKLGETFEWTSERAPTFRLHDYEQGTMLDPDEDQNGRSKSSSRSSFSDHESSKVVAVLHEEEPRLVNNSKSDMLETQEMVEDGPSLHLEKFENEPMKLVETFEWTSERALTFRLPDYEPGTMLELDVDADGTSQSSSVGSFNDHRSPKERVMNHEEELLPVNDYETEMLKLGVTAEDGHGLHLENGANRSMELDEALEPRDDIFKLSPDDTLEQERMMFHLEMSQDKQGDTKEDIPAPSSRISQKGHESPSKMPELDSESEDEISGRHLQRENEKSGLTSEPYPHIFISTEPSEIVGLRHALYQPQSSPLRSPLTSPIHTPIGSPLHYLMSSQTRSPITSPMHSHIVSPLRSPINSSGSLSDVLFFGKKA